MASSWKLKTTLRRKKSLGSMPSPDYTYRERHGEAIYRFKSLPSRRHRRRQHDVGLGLSAQRIDLSQSRKILAEILEGVPEDEQARPGVVQADHRDALEAGGIGAAEVGEPVVVGAKDGGYQRRVRHLEVKEPLRGIEDFTGHPIERHVLEVLLGVVPPAVHVFEAPLGGDLGRASSSRERPRLRRIVGIGPTLGPLGE